MVAPIDLPAASPLEQEDLLWFFNDTDGDLGLRSNYPAMVMASLLGRGGSRSFRSYEVDDCALDAAARRARIAGYLAGAGEQATRVLRAAFTLPRPRKLEKAFGPLAAVVPSTQAALEAHQASHTNRPLLDWLSRLPKRGREDLAARRALEAINAEAGRTLVQALLDYRAAKRKVARHG